MTKTTPDILETNEIQHVIVCTKIVWLCLKHLRPRIKDFIA